MSAHANRPRRGAVLALAAACCAVGAAASARAEPAAAAAEKVDLAELTRRARLGPSVRMSHAATQAARARADEAHAARWVDLELTSFLGPSPKITCDNPDCTRTSPTDATLALGGAFGGASLTAVQPLFTFGKLDAVSAAASAGARAAAALEDAAAGDVAVLAARAYYGLKLARELGWMLDDGREDVAGALDSIDDELAHGSGEATIEDRLRVETLAAEIDARLTEAHQAAGEALAAVRALAGSPTLDIDDAPLAPVGLDATDGTAAYQARARVGRPELGAARAARAAATALVRFERARWWPDLALVGSVSGARAGGVDDPPSAFANDPFNRLGAAIGVVLRWTVSPGSQAARVRRARAEASQADALVDLAERATDLEVDQALVALTEARKRLTASRAGEKSAKAWVAGVLQADAIGVADSKDLGDAYIAYFTFRARALSAIMDLDLAAVRLARVGALNGSAGSAVEGD